MTHLKPLVGGGCTKRKKCRFICIVFLLMGLSWEIMILAFSYNKYTFIVFSKVFLNQTISLYKFFLKGNTFRIILFASETRPNDYWTYIYVKSHQLF